MKNLLLATCLFLCSFFTYAQLTDHIAQVYARFSPGTVQQVFYTNYSVNAEFFVHRNIGLNYNLDLTYRQDSIRQFHSTMGIIGAPILLVGGLATAFDGDSTTSGGLGILGGLLLLALPDGVSGHFSPSYNLDISPYANVLGLDFIKDRRNGSTYIKYACSFGVKTTYLLRERFTFTGFIETRQAAGFGWSFGGGVGFGVVLGKRKIKDETEPVQ